MKTIIVLILIGVLVGFMRGKKKVDPNLQPGDEFIGQDK
jgi:uncharacterized membrane protein